MISFRLSRTRFRTYFWQLDAVFKKNGRRRRRRLPLHFSSLPSPPLSRALLRKFGNLVCVVFFLEVSSFFFRYFFHAGPLFSRHNQVIKRNWAFQRPRS